MSFDTMEDQVRQGDSALTVDVTDAEKQPISLTLPRRWRAAHQHRGSDIMVAVMGATGTGKSTFIRLLTNDMRIRAGHTPESETSDIQTARYVDEKTGLSVMLIDTPGFDDSREGVTDTDILDRIVHFLEPENGERRKLNGILYMHRISDPRIGGVSRKNLRMFHSLCGDANLKNVLIVTTNWSRVGQEEGDKREQTLRDGAFKAFLDAQAGMRRHLNTVASARAIMAELIPLKAVTMQIQHELEAGMTLGDTSAGTVLTPEMWAMQKRHQEEQAQLKREMERVAKANNLALRAELSGEREGLAQRMALAEDDRDKLGRILDQTRKDLASKQNNLCVLHEQTELQSVALEDAQNDIEEKRKLLAEYMKVAEEKHLALERERREATDRNRHLMKQLAKERQQHQRRILANELALKEQAEEAYRKQTELEERLAHAQHEVSQPTPVSALLKVCRLLFD